MSKTERSISASYSNGYTTRQAASLTARLACGRAGVDAARCFAYPFQPANIFLRPHLKCCSVFQVRGVEVGIVLLVLVVWVGAIVLFFNRWGKIRMLLPYQPDYKEQLKVPGTGACGGGGGAPCSGQHATSCSQVGQVHGLPITEINVSLLGCNQRFSLL